VRYILERAIDSTFLERYEASMLARCGADSLPNPRGARHGIFHNHRPWEYQKVFVHGDFRPDDVVLDTGAMHTYFCIYVSQFVRQIYATDNFYWARRSYMSTQKLFSPDEWARYVEAKGDGRLRAEEADLTRLPYPDGTFDKVLCISTIEHVAEDGQAMVELGRVLKRGGRLLLTTEFNPRLGEAYSESDTPITACTRAGGWKS
jgi:SAM-dependent methyltransferase